MEYVKATLARHSLKGVVVATILLLAVCAWAADGNFAPATQTIQSTSAATTKSYTGKVIYDFFSHHPDGRTPADNGMVMDKSGNIFAATSSGGSYQTCSGLGDGSIVELTPTGSGGWNETDIHDFNWLATGPGNGCLPSGLLALDSKGNLYGTTSNGGNNTCYDNQGNAYGCGSVFELSLVNGVWTETTLYSFGSSSTDGYFPWGGVTLGNAAGTILYGTTPYGGANGAGQVWQLTYTKPTKKKQGGWTRTVLHDFSGTGPDGGFPQNGLLLKNGNLYGIAVNNGVVYELAKGSGGFTFSVLATVPDDGYQLEVEGPLAMDSENNIYGTGNSTAWELVYSPGGTYSLEVLYNFTGDGLTPNWGLVYSKGSWFGTTGGWGSYTDGYVFKLTYSKKTGWTETTIYDQFAFVQDGSAVDEPGYNQLIADKSGNLYGMGFYGGYGRGGVFEVSPNP
jgi:hypothetical protein